MIVPDDLRAALDLVTEPDSLRVPRGFSGMAEETLESAGSWTRHERIQGFGIAARRVRGRVTGEVSLKVYVDHKVPLAELAQPAPRRVAIPWVRRPLPVDVEAIGTLHLQQALQGVIRPPQPGCAIATAGMTPGSFGCVVRDVAEGGGTYILSAAHVIAGRGFGPSGRPVLQPGTDTGPSGVVAHLARWGALQFTNDSFPNLFDAAVAVVTGPVISDIHILGKPKGFSSIVTKNMPVKKCGATTGHTEGIVLDPHFRCAFFYPQKDGTTARAGFKNQVLCSKFTEPGDSGAAVLNSEGKVVGLVIGGAQGGSVFSPIIPILERLEITIS